MKRLVITIFLVFTLGCKVRTEDASVSNSKKTDGSEATNGFPAVGALVAVLITPVTSTNEFGGRTRFVTMTVPFCSATLLSPNVVLTAEHCVPASLDQFQKLLVKDANRWSMQNEGRPAVPYLFFSNHPQIWQNNKLSGYNNRLPGPAMQVVERAVVSKMYDSPVVTEANQWNGLILLRLSNKKFYRDTAPFDPTYISNIDLADIALKSYPTIASTPPSEGSVGDLIKKNGVAASVGYGFNKPKGTAGLKRYSASYPKTIKGDFLWSSAEHHICEADGGGPLLATKKEKKENEEPLPMTLDDPSSQEVIGVLHGKPLTWGFIFESYASYFLISDIKNKCATFSQTDVYMMPHSQSKKITEIVDKWKNVE